LITDPIMLSLLSLTSTLYPAQRFCNECWSYDLIVMHLPTGHVSAKVPANDEMHWRHTSRSRVSDFAPPEYPDISKAPGMLDDAVVHRLNQFTLGIRQMAAMNDEAQLRRVGVNVTLTLPPMIVDERLSEE
jgi:hypothetical protein